MTCYIGFYGVLCNMSLAVALRGEAEGPDACVRAQEGGAVLRRSAQAV
jgi:hypothetical protein